MIHFLILCITFFLLGLKNGSYYGKKEKITMLTFGLLWILLMFYTGYFIDSKLIEFLVQIVITSALIQQFFIFHKNEGHRIHWTEYTLGLFIRLGFVMSGADIIMLVMTSWFTDTIFKMPINYYVGRNLIEKVDGTDDNSGKSVGTFTPKWLRKIFPFLKEFYAVPRTFSNGFNKLYVGLVCVFIWLVLYYDYNIRFGIENIIDYLTK